jgi:adenine-specific DNA-methyltransferase
VLADSRDGQLKEAEVTRTAPSGQATHGNIRHGFVYERVPHITLKSIANNAEIDAIWDKWQEKLEPLREQLNAALGKINPLNPPLSGGSRRFTSGATPSPDKGRVGEGLACRNGKYPRGRYKVVGPHETVPRRLVAGAHRAAEGNRRFHRRRGRIEYLYDKPYDNRKAVGVDEDDELIDTPREPDADYAVKQSFPQMILENLKTAGVQQAHKEDRITFTSLVAWPGELVCAEGRYIEQDAKVGAGDTAQSAAPAGVEKRAAIFIGPEFGTVQRADLVEAAREAADAGFDVLIAYAFSYEAHTTNFAKLGKLPVLKARMNADLHMAEDLKNTGKGNLLVIFGEPESR